LKSGVRKVFRRANAGFLTAALFAGLFWCGRPMEGEAAGRGLSLSAAKSLAVANSEKMEQLEGKLATKQASLSQAVRSIQEKKKNMSTFRWTPLLSFHFPTKPDLAEEYEFEFKPVQIQLEIDSLRHQMQDQVLEEYAAVNALYVDIVVLKERLAFDKERLEAAEDALAKNRARLLTGEANRNDVDKMEKSVHTIQNTIAANERSLSSKLGKLGTALGMDVSTGYEFTDPFVDADIPRSMLESLTQYTLERDQNYYEACLDERSALISLRTNYSLMKNQYGQKMGRIQGYVNQALSGQKIKKSAFKKEYELFLRDIDAPWQGKRRILFFKFPKVWFKGQIDGIRYVEDEPYALYEAALEYQDALAEKNAAKAELTEQVEDTFDNYITVRNAYRSAVSAVEEAGKRVQADKILNQIGELPYSEYQAALEEYEELQNAEFEALSELSSTLYAFDRLACGGITSFLEGNGVDVDAEAGGISYIEEEYAGGACYYIEPIIQEEQFRLGVSIPNGFGVQVTDFELWIDNVQVGERTSVTETIRHLAFTTKEVSSVKLRFYNKEAFVDDVEIDPESYGGALEIVSGYHVPETAGDEIGAYTCEQSGTTGMVSIKIMPDAGRNIAFYMLRAESGEILAGREKVPVEEAFQYLFLAQSSLEELVIEFYDSGGGLLYTGYFDTAGGKLMKFP